MKEGKISNIILERSVLKVLGKQQNSLLRERPAAGRDNCCAVIKQAGGSGIVSAAGYGQNAIYTAVNNVAVCGVKPSVLQCCVVMPAAAREIAFRRVMQKLHEDSIQLQVEIGGGHTQVSRHVAEPVITVTAIGACAADSRIAGKKVAPGEDVIVTKHIGIGGIQQIIDKRRSEIEARFNPDFVRRAYGNRCDLSVVSEALIGSRQSVSSMHDASQGGIFAALWDLAEAAHIGLEIDFRKIPVCQEVIEICEWYQINPYELDSTGCLLMTARRGYDIVEILRSEGIPACVVGKATAGNDRILHNKEDIRYLDMPKTDPLYSLV